MQQIRELIGEISKEEGRLQAGRDEAARYSAQGTQRTIIWNLLLSMTLVFAAALLFTRHIARPQREVSALADRISAGNLTRELATSVRSDEIGVLQVSVARMLQSLRRTAESARQIAAGNLEVHPQSADDQFGQAFSRMLQALRQMAEHARQIAAGNLTMDVQPQSPNDQLGTAFAQMLADLRQINRDIRSGIEVLNDSASEIAAGAYQIASGTAETSTAISETSATVEEIKQTAMLSSHRALSVSRAAQRSAQVSQDGCKAVGDVIEGMCRIHQQMELVGENITHLAEQVQTIGEIIATVNSLAEQSKQAAVQVRGILGEIQCATSSTVLAAEQGLQALGQRMKDMLLRFQV